MARRLEAALRPRSVEIADLTEEGFDPRYTPADRLAIRDAISVPLEAR